ncbi:MAG: hypothetical protein K8R90_10220 [Candidatus Cloacimonetes bacterium]|nr:hypothetical protein [Candidatus Cloacimonadota bacterium]
MRKDTDNRNRFLDPDEVHDLPNEQKEYMQKMGFKPYLSRSGRVKWIKPEQHGYKRLQASASGHSRRTPVGNFLASRLGQFIAIALALLAIAAGFYFIILLF